MILSVARRLYYRLNPPLSQWRRLATDFASEWPKASNQLPQPDSSRLLSPLEEFFEARKEGPGIWKWRHYFDIYHRHLQPFRQRKNLVILEIGIYSGGSLDMWREYFDSSASIYGMDIEPSCRAYEAPNTHILIGDQADRSFWRKALADGSLPAPDIVIDDGGHAPEQQRVTLEEILPHIKPGGIYICEDIHGRYNGFSAFVSELATYLNDMEGACSDPDDSERRLVVPTNRVQASLHSVHLYPYVTVVEKRTVPLPELVAPKHGTQWEPFLQ